MNLTSAFLLVAVGLIAGPKGLSWGLDKGKSGIGRLLGFLLSAVGWGALLGGVLGLIRR